MQLMQMRTWHSYSGAWHSTSQSETGTIICVITVLCLVRWVALAPAFDVNPNIDKAEHVLNIDDVDNRPNLETVLSTAAFYGLGDGTSQQVLEEVATTVDGWQDVARRAGISGADIDLTAGAFSAHAELRTQ